MIVKIRGRSIDLHRLTPWLSLLFFCIAIGIVAHEVRTYQWSDILAAVTGISKEHVALAMLWSALGYVVLAAYDFLGMRYVGKTLSAGKVLFASFIGFAVSNNVGHAVVSGGAMRLRFYGNWGLSGPDIAKIVALGGMTYLLGAGGLLLVGYAVTPEHTFENNHLPLMRIEWLVAVVALSMAAYFALVVRHRDTVHTIMGVPLRLPSPRMTIVQTVIGAFDLLLAALVFYTLLVHYFDMPFGYFLGLFVVAQVMGLVSQVPGGIGVFEGLFLYLISEQYPSGHVLGALIVYRIVYYFIPLALAGVMISLYEMGIWRRITKR